jgi:hypothetical protein
LTAPGKDVRLHLKAKQFGDDVRKTLAATQKKGKGNLWGALGGALMESLSIDTTKNAKDAVTKSPRQELCPEWPPVFPLSSPSNPSRIDYCLQPGVIDNEYFCAVMAHSSYFCNPDLLDFLIARFTADDPNSPASKFAGMQDDT